ncbi:MAG: dihydroorotate dehydrogenase [Deltaproteobacteria bacterium]
MKAEDKDLDELFALARSDSARTSNALTERILADALHEMPSAPREQIVLRSKPRGFFGLGWPSFAGLAGVAALGVTLGVLNPAFSDGLVGSDYAISDLMPGFDLDVVDEVAG